MEFTGKVTWNEEKFTYRIAVDSDRLVMTFSSPARVLNFEGAGSDLNCPGLGNNSAAVAPVVRTALGSPGQWEMIETLSVQQAAAAAASGGSSQHGKSVASALRLVVRPVGLPDMQFELQEDLGREDAVEHLKRLKQQLEDEKQARAIAVTELRQQLELLKQQLEGEKQARTSLEAQLTQRVHSAFSVLTPSGLSLAGSLGAQLVCRTTHPGTVGDSPFAEWTETVHCDAAAPVALQATDPRRFDVTRDCTKLEVRLRLHFTGVRPSEVVLGLYSASDPTMVAVTDDVYTATVVVQSVKGGLYFNVYWKGKDAHLVPVAAENWIAFRELR